MIPFPHPSGALLLPSLVPQDVCADWLNLIEQRYATLDAEALIASGDYSPHSSSLRLRALPEITVSDVWSELRRSPEFLSTVHHALGQEISCAVDECWIRRQYAPGRYPPLHAAHSWHQDGALGFDFLALGLGLQPPPSDALLDMLTCWVPLMPCGDDAPGLELIARRQELLMAPVDLTHAQMSIRFAEEESWRPGVGAGDALLFCSDLLHRTGITAGMSRDRVSIELRLFPSNSRPVPQQLRPLVD